MATRELKATVFYEAGELTYNFPFDYIKKSFVVVKYVDNFEADIIDEAELLTYGTDYTIDDKKVTLKEAGDTSKYIYIYRVTPTAPVVDFSDASILTEANLDLTTLQQLHLNEEMSDYLILHKVPSGTLEEIRDAVENANQSSQNAQQSAEDALEAAQNANANAQSINIRTFPNVESMKQANNLKTGGLIKTQGFYQSGDGGGADYVIVDDIGEDEADEASIITLQKGLYAKLLIKDFINIKWFGAYVDGEHDDSTAFNNCVEFLQRTKKEIEQIQALAVKTKVVIPHGVMKISDTIKVDINVMSLDGGGSVILADGLEDNSYAIWVNNWTAKNGYATYANIISQVGNFILTGTNRFDPVNGFLMGTKEAQEGSAVIGYGGARVRMERIMVQNLYTSITWGSNQYLDSWHNISVNHCHVGLDNLSSPFNTGENINFHNSVFFGNDKMYNTSLTMLFNNCSFDYNTQWFNPPVLRAWLTDCHIEGWFLTEQKTVRTRLLPRLVDGGAGLNGRWRYRSC